MNVTVIIATYGDESWEQLAYNRALASLELHQQVIVEHEPAATIAEVRNAAAAKASGDWLCFLDADDELDPGYLAAMRVAWLLLLHGDGPIFHPLPPVLLVPAVSYISSSGFESEPAIPNKGRWPVLNECVIGTLVPAELFREVGGFREFECYEDWDLWLRCSKAGAQLVDVPTAIYRAYVRAGSRNEAARTDTYQQIWADYLLNGGKWTTR